MAEYTLESPHFEAFGRIISGSALVETGIKVTLSAIMHSHSHYVHVLTAPYTANDLYNVAKSLAKVHFSEDENNRDLLIELIGKYKSYTRLRNFIAHSFWVKGTRLGSIRPAYMSVREGRAEGRGFSDEERDYTILELQDAANGLLALYEEFKGFLKSSGLALSMEENIADDNAATEPSEGTN